MQRTACQPWVHILQEDQGVSAGGGKSGTRLTYFGLSAKSMLCPKQQNLVRTWTLSLAPREDCRYFPMMPSDGPYMSARAQGLSPLAISLQVAWGVFPTQMACVSFLVLMHRESCSAEGSLRSALL